MNYFVQIMEECEKLDEKADAYLSKLPFMPNDDVAERLHKAAWKQFKDAGEDWGAIPDWVADIVDGHMPYYGIPHNGSILFSLGFSVASQEAHLRNLMEIAEGRETEMLDFPTVVKI